MPASARKSLLAANPEAIDMTGADGDVNRVRAEWPAVAAATVTVMTMPYSHPSTGWENETIY